EYGAEAGGRPASANTAQTSAVARRPLPASQPRPASAAPGTETTAPATKDVPCRALHEGNKQGHGLLKGATQSAPGGTICQTLFLATTGRPAGGCSVPSPPEQLRKKSAFVKLEKIFFARFFCFWGLR